MFSEPRPIAMAQRPFRATPSARPTAHHPFARRRTKSVRRGWIGIASTSTSHETIPPNYFRRPLNNSPDGRRSSCPLLLQRALVAPIHESDLHLLAPRPPYFLNHNGTRSPAPKLLANYSPLSRAFPQSRRKGRRRCRVVRSMGDRHEESTK